jgi:hypothetical protein
LLSRTRLAAALLAALPLALAVPGTARAAGVYRRDDGTMETSLRMDSSDGKDSAYKSIVIPDHHVTGATGATLRVYAKAAQCGATGASQRVWINSHVLADFNPCTVWPSATFGWGSFTVPIAWLREASEYFGYNDIGFSDLGTSTDRNAYYAVDSDTPGGYDIVQQDSTGVHQVPGQLLVYLELTGSVPAMSFTPPGYGVRPIGSTTEQTVTVRSIGLEPLDVTGVAIGGTAPADWAVTGDTCTGATLPPDATCAVRVAFTPSAKGPRPATLTVSARSGASRGAALTGEGRSDPPVSAFTTAGGAVLLPGDPLRGTVTDDLGVTAEYVTLVPVVPGEATVTTPATLSCDAAATACAWSTTPFLTVPGQYVVTAHGVDVQGVAESPGPSVTVVIV